MEIKKSKKAVVDTTLLESEIEDYKAWCIEHQWKPSDGKALELYCNQKKK